MEISSSSAAEQTAFGFERAEKAWCFAPTGAPPSRAAAPLDLSAAVPPPSTAECFAKWGLTPRLSAACVRITGRRFSPLGSGGGGGGGGGAVDEGEREASAFLTDLFASAALREQLVVFDRSGAARRLPERPSGAALRFEPLRSTATSLAFFDRLVDAGAVVANGYIRKRMDEDVAGLLVCDLLREALVCPDEGSGEFAGLYAHDERRELLFALLRLVVCGGPLCQYEDNWRPYLDAARAMYRDLATVTKADGSGEAGGVRVVSHAYKVTAADGLFDCESPHHVCIVSVDPLRRTCAVIAHTYLTGVW